MRRQLGRLLRTSARRIGLGTTRVAVDTRGAHDAAAIDDVEIWRRVAPFTMTSPERIQALVDSVRHLERHHVAGSFVECGVWRGGSMMAAALALAGATNRELFLFDTYEGNPAPGDPDVDHRGVSAAQQLAADPSRTAHISAVAHLEDVRRNMASTGYPESLIHYVAGNVEDTIPAMAPDRIALLRLDTDWYASTRHELQHLFPRMVSGGVLIVDDYGHWRGARQAVDEYLDSTGVRLLLCRIDYTGRIAVVP
jgi:hypothetical protein